jgi:hypothetical protein
VTEALLSVNSEVASQAFVFSSVYPGAAHDPSIARMLLPGDEVDLRWVDARLGLIFPGGESAALIAPSSTPLHPVLANYVTETARVRLRDDDLDPEFTRYHLQAADWPATGKANFGGALALLDARWRDQPAVAGGVAELITTWRVTDADQVGPIVPPAFKTDVVLFTHVLDENGNIVAQHDSLEAPSWDWQNGDVFIQVHPLFIPPETTTGNYSVVVGVYDRASGIRLPLLGSDEDLAQDYVNVVPLNINE